MEQPGPGRIESGQESGLVARGPKGSDDGSIVEVTQDGWIGVPSKGDGVGQRRATAIAVGVISPVQGGPSPSQCTPEFDIDPFRSSSDRKRNNVEGGNRVQYARK